MDKIKWCLKQKKGVKIIAQNVNLSDSYVKRADEDLKNIDSHSDVWKVIISYYACYNALYAVLVRCGLRCEIHDCSIEIMKFFDYLNNLRDFMKELKENRVNTQYYLKKPVPVSADKVKNFIEACKLELDELNTDKIERIRREISGCGE